MTGMVPQSSTDGNPPPDPIGIAVAEFVGELLSLATIRLEYRPADLDASPPPEPGTEPVASESRQILDGWITTLTVDFEDRIPSTVAAAQSALGQTLHSLPAAALTAAHRFQAMHPESSELALSPALTRALRDTVVIEFLAQHSIWTGTPNATHGT